MLKPIVERERERAGRHSLPSCQKFPVYVSRLKRAGEGPLDPLSWRERAVGDLHASSVVYSVAGCGSSHGKGKDEKGGGML